MQGKKTQKAVIIKAFGSNPQFGQFDIPEPNENQVQIKVIGSTINPSDRAAARGGYKQAKVPFVGGLEGFGEVVKAGKQENSHIVGKKVSFTTMSGSWAEYSVANVDNIWIIDEDVPIECSSSGIVNPLTVIGIVETFKKSSCHGVKGKGLINTAAASALGRMLIKYCKRQNIPLLNVVRRPQQVKLLENQGATKIIDTSSQNWVEKYKKFVKQEGFNVLFDAIGGGQVTQTLISCLAPLSQVYVYGKLTMQPFILKKPLVGLQGTTISNFMLFEWYSRISKEQKDAIKKDYSSLLKNELCTYSLKTIKLQELPAQWTEAQKRATQGKYTIKI